MDYPPYRRIPRRTKAPFHEQSETKQQTRERLVELARESGIEVGSIFTLPSREAFCANYFHAEFPDAKLQGVERQEIVWENIDRSSGIEVMRGDIWTFMQRKPQAKFDLIFLDLTGVPAADNLQTVAEFIDRHAAPRCVIGCTFVEKIHTIHAANVGDTLEAASGSRDITADNVAKAIQQQCRTRLRTRAVQTYRSRPNADESWPMLFIGLSAGW